MTTETNSSTAPLVTNHRKGFRRYLWFWAISLSWLLFDQVTKLLVLHVSGWPANLYPPFGGVEIIPGFFSLVYVQNFGAAWGLLSNQRVLLTVIAVVALVAIYGFRVSLGLRERRFQIAFGFLVGGILGNLIDRLAYGFVVDFLDFLFGSYRYPTFNVADIGIVCGTISYIIMSWMADSSKNKANPKLIRPGSDSSTGN